jgi:hypothetical protein
MQIRYADFTAQQALPLILAGLLIFAVPLILRRRRGPKDDQFRLQKQEPRGSNATKADMMELLSALITFSRRNRIGIVFPGTVEYGNEVATLLALLVTKSEVIGVNSFGYGGTITEGKGDGDWKQRMNGQDIRIKSPTVMNRQQQAICRQAMDAAGMKDISFRVAGVFSNRHVTLDTGKGCGLWTKESFFEELKTQLAVEEERISDPQKVVDQLVAITKRVRPEKKKK